MPRYRDDEYDDQGDRRGVHRRRLERRGSNTPIIVGAVIIGVAVIGIVLAMVIMGGKDDDETKRAKVRSATERFLLAVQEGDVDKIFQNMNVEGAEGWVTKRLGVKLGKRYRFWDQEPDRDVAMKWRQEQDQRMVSEITKIMKDLALDDTAAIERVIQGSKIRFEMNTAKMTLTNRNGQGTLWLQSEKGGEFIVVNWQLDQAASGR